MSSFNTSLLPRVLFAALGSLTATSYADENLFGYVKGSEVLPVGASELYQVITRRNDKGLGEYTAFNTDTEFEYGFTDHFTASASLKGQAIDTSGLVIDGYMPGDKDYGLRLSGFEIASKYNFLSPALDNFGLSLYTSFDYSSLDPHSGQDKDTYSLEFELLAQKYFMEGQMIWVGNLGMESTGAKRAEIDNLPEDFEWPTELEVELEFKLSTGLSYRFVPNWYVGFEGLYETEFETEVGQERWSFFAGPTLHYGGEKFWVSLTYLSQLEGGGEQYNDQADSDLHLIEKTKNEMRLKVGLNF